MRTVVVQARASAGRRRAGRFWPGTPVETELDEATIAALEADPVLIVREPRLGETLPQVNGVSVEALQSDVAELEQRLAGAVAASERDSLRLRELEAENAVLRKQVAELEALFEAEAKAPEAP